MQQLQGCCIFFEIDHSNENISVISGLSGTDEIKTDKRTVIDYFLEPIDKGFGESLKEKSVIYGGIMATLKK